MTNTTTPPRTRTCKLQNTEAGYAGSDNRVSAAVMQGLGAAKAQRYAGYDNSVRL
jgi:hypothetical protein